MKITPELFHAYLKCPIKCWLRATYEQADGNEYADWFKTQNERYRASGTERLIATSSSDNIAASPHEQSMKSDKWRLATNLATHAKIDSWVVESELQAVERVPSTGRGKPAQFIPIRFIFTNKLRKEDKLLVAFDAFVLSKSQAREIKNGRIIHGDDYTTFKLRTTALTGEVRKHLGKIAALLSSKTPPDLTLNRHCSECEFQTHCRKNAVEQDDLSLLAGMSTKERKKFRSKGIFTITQLSYTFRPRRRSKRQRDKREKYHHALKALAIREKKIHMVGNLELKIEGTPVYLDVEGLPDRDFFYLIGLRIGHGDSAVQHNLWADTVVDEGKIWQEFLAILETVEKPALIHYGSYETNFMKQMANRYGHPEAESAAAKAIVAAINLVSVLFAKIYFPTFTNGLKEIVGSFGFRWSEVSASGAASIAWRQGWEDSHSTVLMQRLITYNSEDCAALARLKELLEELLPKTGAGKLSADVVQADSLPRSFPCTFKSNQFQFTEFEQINQAAYWNYQRERVFVKSSEHLKRVARKNAKKKRLTPCFNKIVDWPRPTICPKCGGLKIYKHQTAMKTVIDVRFGSGSVKKWVTRYRFHYFRCPMCRAVFYNSERAWDGQKFGRNLQVFCIYQNIELRLPQRQIAAFLNSVFGFQLSPTMVNAFKEGAAAFYQATHEAMLQSIIDGCLVHADETKVNLGGQDGYVWVFTNLEEAVYVYSPSREGDLAQLVLKDFKGVLVSDFYQAYDCLNCVQQKCLIHLIRDLNDSVFKEPFNTEFKELVGEFAGLIKPMIETIERFGLKRRFLQIHKADVRQFFTSLTRRKYRSETALKCKQRMEKNRETLFAFLDYDGVPWNNNNAEHAVKAFALLRRDFDGLTTEKGVKEYLILLSVCQTCKNLGVNFLDFLRSGDRDIRRFAESRPKCVR